MPVYPPPVSSFLVARDVRGALVRTVSVVGLDERADAFDQVGIVGACACRVQLYETRHTGAGAVGANLRRCADSQQARVAVRVITQHDGSSIATRARSVHIDRTGDSDPEAVRRKIDKTAVAAGAGSAPRGNIAIHDDAAADAAAGGKHFHGATKAARAPRRAAAVHGDRAVDNHVTGITRCVGIRDDLYAAAVAAARRAGAAIGG